MIDTNGNFTVIREAVQNLVGFSRSDNANALNCPGDFRIYAHVTVIVTLFATTLGKRAINRVRDNLCKFIATPIFL